MTTRPISTADWLLDVLRTSILKGTLPAHSLIRQEELAAKYGVSRMPVRDALRLLEAEGLIISRPNRGVIVAPLLPEEALEIFDIRAALESLALKRSISRMSDEHKAEAIAALKTLEEATPEKMSAAHRTFHLSLAAAAGDRLLKLIGQYLDASARYLRVEATLEETAAEDRYEHRALLDACLEGNIRAATRLVEKHVGGTGLEVAEVLQNRNRLKEARSA